MLNKDLYERYLQKKAKKLGISVEELKGGSMLPSDPVEAPQYQSVQPSQPEQPVAPVNPIQQPYQTPIEPALTQNYEPQIPDRRENKFCVIGYPLGHSLSSVIHNAGFKSMGINASYETLETPPETLVERIKYLKNNNYKGFNVTIPLKLPVALFID